MSITFFVPGIPQPQGSTRAYVRGGKPVVTSDNAKLRPWRAVVALAAQNAMEGHIPAGAGVPVTLGVVFILPRPKAIGKKHPPHTKRPDLDKLLRAALDALKGVCYADDSQVDGVALSKRYAPFDGTSGPGALITISHGGGTQYEAKGTPFARISLGPFERVEDGGAE